MKTPQQEVIEDGQITLLSDGQKHRYTIRMLAEEDLPAVMQLQRDVLSVIRNKECCVPVKAEELLLMLGDRGQSVGLFIEDKIYAECSLLYPGSGDNNMARELNFSKEQLESVCQLELALVHWHLRGYKMQQKLAGLLVQRVEQTQRARFLFTTVSPYNYPSIQTVTALGMQINKLCKMYFNWDRYIVYRDFVKPVQLDMENIVTVLNTSFEAQQKLLAQGYRGFSQTKDQEGIKILYAKKTS